MAFQNLNQTYKPGDVSEDDIRDELSKMEQNPGLDTRVLLKKEDLATLQLITFQEKHLEFLKKNPKINPMGYLANLRTMIKIRK